MLKVRLILLPLLFATPGCALFAGARPTATIQGAGCSSLIPEGWRQPVAGAPLPAGNEVGDWISFGDQQTGKLDQANGRTIDAIYLVERCEARDAEAVKRAQRGWLARLFK